MADVIDLDARRSRLNISAGGIDCVLKNSKVIFVGRTYLEAAFQAVNILQAIRIAPGTVVELQERMP